MMTTEQAQRIRVLMQEALDLILRKPIAFVLVAQDEGGGVEIITNAARKDLLPDLLKQAAVIVTTPPDGEIAEPFQDRAPVPSPGADQTPAQTAAPERCWRKVAPAFVEQCQNEATGGIRLKLFASQAIQKRYGKRSLLELVLDLPVCAQCFSKMKPHEVMSEEQWREFGKVAQRRNHGILAAREETELVHIPFSDQAYQALRKQMAAAASQSAPAGPQQEGTGDGRRTE